MLHAGLRAHNRKATAASNGAASCKKSTRDSMYVLLHKASESCSP